MFYGYLGDCIKENQDEGGEEREERKREVGSGKRERESTDHLCFRGWHNRQSLNRVQSHQNHRL